MKLLSKLIIREIVPPMVISLVIFLFVFLMRTIAELAKMLIKNQYTLAEVGMLLLYNVPALLGFVIPMGLLLGVILGLNRLSSDSEIIALTSGGISMHTLLMPILLIAFVAWLVNTFVMTEAIPWANTESNKIIMRHTSQVINSEIVPRVFNENFSGYIIFVNEIDDETGEWRQVFIFDDNNNDPGNPTAILSRKANLLESDTSGTIDLQVFDYHSYSFPRDTSEDPPQVTQGGTTIFHIVEGRNLEERVTGAKQDRSKTVKELLEDVERDKNMMIYRVTARNNSRNPENITVQLISEGGEPVEKTIEIPPARSKDQNYEIGLRMPDGYEDKPIHINILWDDQKLLESKASVDEFADRRYRYQVAKETEIKRNVKLLNSQLIRVKTNSQWIEIHKKFALPFTCLIFALLGMPLGLSSRRGGKAYGYIVGIGIFILYWGLQTTGERLALYERLSPELGVWLPNLVFGAIALLLIIRKRLEIRLPGLSAFLLRVRTHENYVDETVAQQNENAQTDNLYQQSKKSKDSELKVGRVVTFPHVLDRYVITTFLKMFTLVFLAMYSLFSLVQYIDRSNDIQKNDVDPAIIFDFFMYQAPETVYWIIPISTLMGTLICFGLLSKNHEVVAFKSSGISIYRLSAPIALMAIALSMVSFFNQDFIIPNTSSDLARVKSIISAGPVQTHSDPGNRWILAENKQAIYYFHQYDEENATLNELHIYQINTQTHELSDKIYAQKAAWSDGSWIAENNSWQIRYEGFTSTQEDINDGSPLPISETPLYFGQQFRPADQMSFGELEDYIASLRQYGLETTKEEFELNWKLAFPFLPIVMTILGLPFSFSSARRGGALTGIFISIFAVIIYWGIMTLFKALGETGYLPGLMAAWSPNVAFLGIGALLFISIRS